MGNTVFTRQLRNSYEGFNIMLMITNGNSGLALSLDSHAEGHTTVTMTPEQAREIAADLIARADSIEGK